MIPLVVDLSLGAVVWYLRRKELDCALDRARWVVFNGSKENDDLLFIRRFVLGVQHFFTPRTCFKCSLSTYLYYSINRATLQGYYFLITILQSVFECLGVSVFELTTGRESAPEMGNF